MQKLKENSSTSEKNSNFPNNLRETLGEKISTTKNDCHRTEFFLVLIVLQRNSSELLVKVYEKFCPSTGMNIHIKVECNKKYNTEIKLA